MQPSVHIENNLSKNNSSHSAQAKNRQQTSLKQVLYKLDRRAKAKKFDLEKLLDIAAKDPREVFNADWDPETKGLLLKLKKQIEIEQKRVFREDGVPSDYFEHKKEKAPAWVIKQAENLRATQFSSHRQESFVMSLAKASEIRDEDLVELQKLCKGETSCIEKSIFSLIDANHQLSESQFRLVSRFFQEN